jgi:hypothetical protein
MTKPVSFKQSDVERAIRAVTSAGLKVTTVKFNPDGGFAVLTGDNENEDNLSPLERWERENGLRAA